MIIAMGGVDIDVRLLVHLEVHRGGLYCRVVLGEQGWRINAQSFSNGYEGEF